MSRLRWLYLLTITMIFGSNAGAVEAVASYNIFHRTARNGSDSAFVEITWKIVNSSIHYKKNEAGELFSQVQSAVTISNDTGVLLRDRFILQTRPLLAADASKQKIMDLRSYPLPAGKWKLQVALGETAFQKDAFIYKDSLEVTPLVTPAFSNIQLLDTFFSSMVPSPVLKNGFQQIPLPLNFLDEGHRNLHFYTELYTDKNQSATTGKILTRYFYISRRPLEIPYFDINYTDTVTDNGTLHTTLHTFYTGRVPSGNYYLNALLKDAAGNRLASTVTFFQVVNKKPDAPLPSVTDTSKHDIEAGKSNYFNLANTFVAKYNQAQLRAILKMILPQADPTEIATINNFFKRPDEMYTRYFIYNYFSKYNKVHPEEEWKAFSEKIKEVNREFNAGGQMGYETERGIVYIQYGKPDERVRVPSESGAVPYEIWRYNNVGNTSQVGLFLFYQPGNASGDYRILHSTAPGQRYNPAWRSMLYSTGQASRNGNSRAEQYFGDQ
jgi:GWxTD domain-containing protein